MSLTEQINDDLKSAMKAKDKLRMQTLRSMKATLMIDLSQDALSKEEEIKLLSHAAKKRKDSAEIYKKAGRSELEEKELAEVEIINEYLPKQLSDQEITDIVKASIDELKLSSMKDIGQLMKAVMPKLQGQADGKRIQGIARSILE